MFLVQMLFALKTIEGNKLEITFNLLTLFEFLFNFKHMLINENTYMLRLIAFVCVLFSKNMYLFSLLIFHMNLEKAKFYYLTARNLELIKNLFLISLITFGLIFFILILLFNIVYITFSICYILSSQKLTKTSQCFRSLLLGEVSDYSGKLEHHVVDVLLVLQCIVQINKNKLPTHNELYYLYHHCLINDLYMFIYLLTPSINSHKYILYFVDLSMCLLISIICIYCKGSIVKVCTYAARVSVYIMSRCIHTQVTQLNIISYNA